MLMGKSTNLCHLLGWLIWMTKFQYFYLKVNFTQTYDLGKFIVEVIYGVTLFQLKISIKCMFYTSLYPITKEIKLF